MPRAAKITGCMRVCSRNPLPLVAPELSASSIGPHHQLTSAVIAAAPASANSPTRPTRVASQRVREMLCVHASRCVPFSSSRATSGAPQKTPMTAGSASMASTPTPYTVAWLPPWPSVSIRVAPVRSGSDTSTNAAASAARRA